MEFHEKLQELRKRRGITQEELSQALYVSRTAVSKWESGRGYPNIDSLKAISAYFSVTVDALLSSDEVLTIAENEQKQKRDQMRDLIFGLLNVSAVLFFFLPCFGQRVNGVLQEVSLLALTAVASYVRILYLCVVVLVVMIGVLLLLLQHCRYPFWTRWKYAFSLSLNGIGVFSFILGSQPYAASLLLVFAVIQVSLLVKRW